MTRKEVYLTDTTDRAVAIYEGLDKKPAKGILSVDVNEPSAVFTSGKGNYEFIPDAIEDLGDCIVIVETALKYTFLCA